MSEQYIKSPQALASCLLEMDKVDFLTLDTEFIRTKTYYAQLALVQIFDGNTVYLIDPIEVKDLSSLWALLATKLLVLHSFGEDIELLYRLAPTLSPRILDTQVACAFLGDGISLGYAGALDKYLDIQISKSQSRTDWLQRPLTKAQLSYAKDDVVYLYQLYQKLQQQLLDAGLFDYFEQECQFQIQQRIKPVNAEAAYRSIKNSWQLSSQQLSVLQMLASWRLSVAIKRNMALGWVIKHENLLQLAKVQPQTEQQLSGLMHPFERRYHGKVVLKIIEQAKDLDPCQWPEKLLRPIDLPNYSKELKRVQVIIKQVATDNALPLEVLASKKIINQYLMWVHQGRELDKPPVLLTSWRLSLFEKRL